MLKTTREGGKMRESNKIMYCHLASYRYSGQKNCYNVLEV